MTGLTRRQELSGEIADGSRVAGIADRAPTALFADGVQ
jgi:hypothetical protein